MISKLNKRSMDILVSNLTCLLDYEMDTYECTQVYSLRYLTFHCKYVMALELSSDPYSSRYDSNVMF